MVAIVAGNSLGLSLTSLATTGQDGTVGSSSGKGRNGEQVYVNSETGNLVVQDQDEYVAARGLDISGLRTYNSQAKVVNGIPDSWGVGPMRLKVLPPTTWGSGAMTRTDVDGAEATYTWDARGYYITTTGAGAYDTISKDASNQYIWTDGTTQTKEYYDSTGKLLKTVDAENNTITYGYTNGRLTSATGAGGELFTSNYTAAGDLQDLTTTLPGGAGTKRVYYEYDTSQAVHRLQYVRVDITPSDGTIADADTYWTRYDYVGSSSLISTISQTDGTSLTFTYDASNRVKTVTASSEDGLSRAMTFSYDSAIQTTIADPAGSSVVMQTDASGRLKQVSIGGQLQHLFTYVGATDDLQTVTDAVGNVLTYSEDSTTGNLNSRLDSLGNGISGRTYNTANQVTGETLTGSGTTNYIYVSGSSVRVHYEVSAAGRVTEYKYDGATGYGQRTAMLVYDDPYTGALTESALDTWAASRALTSIGRTDYVYSAQGQLASTTVYGAVLAGRVGDAANALTATTTYTYNTQGQLVTSDEPGLSGATLGVTTYSYDGMGRQISVTNTLSQLTVTSYDDANNTTTVTFANGLTTASTWDASGNLVSVLSSGAVAGSSTTTYAYDADNRLVMTTDPTNVRTFNLYDNYGNLVGSVDGDGTLTEFMYDAAHHLTRTVKYTTAVASSSLYNSTTHKPINPSLATIRPASQTTTDKSSWNAYDITGRLLKTVDGEGAVTEYTYDSASRVVQTKQYATALTSAQMNALGNAPAPSAIAPSANAANDRVSRNFYDADGLLTGTLDAAGYLRKLDYDGAGRLVQATNYATLTTAADRASGTFATLQSEASAGSGHEVTTYLYDAKGLQVGVIDARGYLTEYVYDLLGRQTSSIRYTNPAKTPYSIASTVANVRPTAAASDITTSCSYDDLNRKISETDARGTVTTFSYDAAGNLTLATASSNVSADARAIVARQYDEFSRVIKDASAQNYAKTTWTKATVYTYDAAGRRIAATDPSGSKSFLYYDNEGRLAYSIDALGGVVEYDYNALDNNTSEIHYQKAVATTGLTGGLVTTAITNLVSGVKNTALDWRVDYTYTRDGKVSSTKDANGNLSYVFYDAFDEPIYTVDGAGGAIANKFDADGRVVQTTRYANAVAGVTPTTTIGQLQSLITPASDGSDQVVNNVYDMDGRLTATVNGLGEVVKFHYDANGNVTDSRAYVNRVSGWTPGSAINTVDSADDRWVRTMYDSFGRAVYSVDGTGAVVTYKYDANGNVLERRAYATAINPSSFTGSTQVLPATSGSDQSTINLYDSADRLQWTEDGTGAVTRFFYDDDGNVVQKVEYATQLSPGTTPSAVTASAGNDRITNFFYDVSGRLIYTVDTLKEVTGFVYDNNGNVTQRRQYTKLASAAPAIGTIPASFTAPSTDTTNDRVTRMAYDAENRLVYTVDPVGDVTENTYDACGNITAITQHATIVAATTLKTLASTVSAISAALGAANAADRKVTRTFYGDNSLKTTVDGIGHVTTYTYNGIDEVKTEAESGPSTTARTTTYSYDGAGRTLNTKDALNNTESYSYDGVGNRVSFTNKKNATWTYDYDAAGRITDEHTPVVDVFTMTDANIGSPTLAWTSIQTHNVYDALGNVTQRTEGYGGAVQRTTKYDYDALGRQVRTTFPAFATYISESDAALASNGQGAAATRSESTLAAPYSETYYDALGNATGSRDVGGAYSYKLYDVMGRVIKEVDALGYVTAYTVDVYGTTTAITRYASAVSLPANAKSLTAAQATAPAAPANNPNRVLNYTLDALGRVTKVVEPSGSTFDLEATTQNSSGAKTTSTAYNAFGEVNKITYLRNAALSGYEYRYYDNAGNLSETVDAAGFVTTYGYDGVGNLTRKTEFAKAYTGTVTTGSPPTATVDSNNDRTTTYTYDLLNRKASETRLNVEATDQDTFTTSRASVVTSYGYDAVGNQISVTTDAGTAYTYYDVIGRVNAISQPPRAGETAGSTLTPLTIFRRDVFGDAILEGELTQGVTTADANWYSGDSPDARDRYTYIVYDIAGHAVRTLDANGGNHYASYDVYGHKAKEWQSVGTGASTATIFHAYSYDALGRLTKSRDPVTNTVATTTTTFNGFGEMTGRSTSGVSSSEYWEYDGAGRLWRTNEGDGVDKIYLYDQMGRRTSVLSSGGNGSADKDIKTITNAATASTDTTFHLRRTDYKFDLLGREIQETLPERSESYSDVNVRDTSATAAASSGTASSDDVNLTGWHWTPSSVSVNWNSIAGLGDGDVKVVLQYATLGASYDPDNNVIYSENGTATGQWIFPADSSSTGAAVTIEDTNSPIGGISRVTRITIYKTDATGNWVQLTDHPVPETAPGGNVVDVEKMAGFVSEDIQVLDTQTTGAQWTTVPKSLWFDMGAKYVVDLRTYDPNRYQYRLMGTMSGGAQTALFTSTLSNTTASYSGATQSMRPTITKTVDRWGNLTSATDPRSAAWVTKYEYNASNQLVRQTLPIDSTIGTTSSTPPVQIYYDKLGRQVGVSDANGHTNRLRYDTQGNVIEEIHADGGHVVNNYDNWGEKIASIDAENNKTTYKYNGLGLLTDVTHWGEASAGFDVFSSSTSGTTGVTVSSTHVASLNEHTDWDAAGRKIAQTDASGNQTQYQYDLRSNIVKTLLPSGATWTSATWDARDHKVSETDGNNNVATWTYDYFGRVTAHKDIGAAVYSYAYDNAKQLKTQTNTRGQNLTYSYSAAGQLMQVNDAAVGQTTTYTYDWAGNKTSEQVLSTASNTLIQDNHLAYDALGRLRWASDDNATVNISYDLVGNRTHITTHVINDDGTNTFTNDEDRYYTYDAMNRQTIVDGVWDSVNKKAVLATTQGHQLTYDKNGNRLTDTYYGKVVQHTSTTSYSTSSTNQQLTETYSYDGLNRLATIRRSDQAYVSGAWVNPMIDIRGYDAAGHQIQSGGDPNIPSGYLSALYGSDANGNPVEGNGSRRRLTVYDANGKVLRQNVSGVGGSYTVDDAGGYDGAGNLITYKVIQGGTTSTYTTTLAKFEGYKESSVSGVSTVLRPGTTNSHYDANGFLTSVDEPGIINGTRNFVNDLNGQVLETLQPISDYWNGTQWQTVDNTFIEREMIVNGEVLARYGAGIDPVTPRKNVTWNYVQPNINNNIADFELGYRSITPTYPLASAGQYTVQSGDSLRSIAQSAFGDADLWYEVAQANGVDSDSDLRVGMSLTIPSIVASHNNANTFVPYDPSKIVGDTTPFLAPPPLDDNSFGEFLEMVVTAAVMILAPEAMALHGLEAALVGGALGSTAGQLTGMAAGSRDHFSLKEVALSAVGSAVSFELVGMKPLGAEAGTIANAAARAAITSVATQGIGIAIGLQHSFSWKSVAASALGGGVGAAAGRGLGLGADGGRPLGMTSQDFVAANVLKGFAAGTATAILSGGKMAAARVAADAFGNALGQGLVDQANRPSTTDVSPAVQDAYQSVLPKCGPYAGINFDQAREYGFVLSDLEEAFDGLTADASDKLKLSGARARALEEDIAKRNARADTKSRVDELTKNIADLNALGNQPDVYTGTGIRVGSRLGLQLQTNADAVVPSDSTLNNFTRGLSGDYMSVLEAGGERPISYSLGSGLRAGLGLVYDGLTGAGDFHTAGQEFNRGNYVSGSMYALRGLGTAGLTAMTAGDYALARASVESTGLRLTAETTAESGINPRLLERLDAWRTYQANGGQYDLQGWVQRTQGAPWGTGFKSGYGDWVNSVESVHGNSLLSTRPTTLYKLYTDEGEFLKWGISQNMNTRYSGAFMADKRIFEFETGKRTDMLRLERDMVETQPGPLNFEPWAGKRKP